MSIKYSFTERYVFSCCVLAFAFLSCNSISLNVSPKTDSSKIIFQTGFEEGQSIIRMGNNSKLVGKDNSLKSFNDIVERETTLSTGQFYFNYTGGDSTKRFAKIVDDPTGLKNKVLHYRIISPWSAENSVEKARVQYEFYSLKSGLKSFKQSVRIFLPRDINVLRTYPAKIDWLTIAEFWNNITWSQSVPYGFRVTLGIGKSTAQESDLTFLLDGQDCELFADGRQRYTTIWAAKNEQVKVPIGEWFTLSYEYKEGDNKTGNFKMHIETATSKYLVFNVNNFTHHTKDPNPDGVTHFNPMKLYTNKDIANFMKNKGKTLDVYWDDLKIWEAKR